MKILVADDELAIRELVGEVLSADGHEVTAMKLLWPKMARMRCKSSSSHGTNLCSVIFACRI